MRQTLFRAALLLTATSLGAQTSEQAIRNLIRTFADARNAGNGAAVAALYSEDGEWIPSNNGVRARGSAALTRLWTNLPGKVQRTVQSIDFPSDRIAVVRVATLYDDPAKGLHHEVLVLVRQDDQWRIKVHHTVD
jgi:uncharacterized protein (TIGR02246 family)